MEWLSLNASRPVNNIISKGPSGWIQFKGTDICMDVKCSCGNMTHIDGEFVYFIKCVECGKVYELNGHIELIERNDEDKLIEEGITIHDSE
jgi:hypothetical protein